MNRLFVLLLVALPALAVAPAVTPIALPLVGAGPAGWVALGAITLGGILGSIFGLGGGKAAPVRVATNPITGSPVPRNPETGEYEPIDPTTGFHQDLIDQLWQQATPDGLDLTGFNETNYIRNGLPFWITNRLREASDRLGGWTQLAKWLEDRNNWSQILGIMQNPWGQSEYDQIPDDVDQSQQAGGSASGGQEVPQGQGEPVGYDADGNPIYQGQGTGQTSGSGGGITGPLAAAGAGAAAMLGPILAGGGANEGQATSYPQGQGPTGYDAEGNPIYSTDTTGAQQQEGLPADFYTTVYGGTPTPTPSPYGGLALGASGNWGSSTGGGGQTPTFGTTVYGQPWINANPPAGGSGPTFYAWQPTGGGGGGTGGSGGGSTGGPTLGGTLGGALGPVLGGAVGGLVNQLIQPSQQPQQQPSSILPTIAQVAPSEVSQPVGFPSLPPQGPVASLFQPQQQQQRRVPTLGELLMMGGLRG